MGNKADEQACLDCAVKACLAQHGISKRIGLLLSGEDIQRDSVFFALYSRFYS